jgi:hypothetical protein
VLVKLISRFRDYYDALRAYDRDETPVYVRETKVHRFRGPSACSQDIRRAMDPLWTDATVPPMYPPSFIQLGPDHDDEGRIDFVRGVIGFCARIYAFVVLNGHAHFDFAGFGTPVPRNRRDRRADVAYWRSEYQTRAWADFQRNRTRTVGDHAFRFFDAPVLLMTDEVLVVNPRLNDWGFATQVDPYTAWQDLSMYLGNNLVKNVMVARPITDELKAEAHGFDKQSFRRTKTGRKKLDRGEW